MKFRGEVWICAAALTAIGCASNSLEPMAAAPARYQSNVGYGSGESKMDAEVGSHGAAWNASQEQDKVAIIPSPAFQGGRGTQWQSKNWSAVGVRPVTTAGKGTQWNDSQGLDTMAVLDESPSLSTFEGALKRTGMDRELDKLQKFTVFAPTDFAFKQMTVEMQADLFGPEGNDRLKDLVRRHVVVGSYNSQDLTNAGQLVTLAGTRIDVVNMAGLPQPGGAQVLSSSETRSGFVHQIDRVLQP
jgi:uncharacterized surface protein with fasciclin (FAS1) repeats